MKIRRRIKSIKHFHLRQSSIARRTRKINARKPNFNKKKYNKKRKPGKKRKVGKFGLAVQHVKVKANNNFSLNDAPENVLKIIKQMDECIKHDGAFSTQLQLDLSQITKIDIGAICILLSKVHELTISNKRVRIYGNYPQNPTCARIFEESGFLDYMWTITGKKIKKKSDNLLIKVGYDKTENERVGKHIKSAMKFLTGIEQHYQPVFSIIQEMCANSVEHANKSGKNWLLGINFVRETEKNQRYVIFTLTDIGYGILNTINRKWPMKIVEAPLEASDILLQAFKKRYGSKTEDKNRNKGLPRILSMSERHLVKGLKVITNNVVLDFEREANTRVLHGKLDGTYYEWMVDITCLDACSKLKQ